MKTKYIVRFHTDNTVKMYSEEYVTSSEAITMAMQNAHLNTEVVEVRSTTIWSSKDK